MSTIQSTLIILALLVAVPVGKVVGVLGTAISVSSQSTLGKITGAVASLGGFGTALAAALILLGGVIYGIVSLVQSVA